MTNEKLAQKIQQGIDKQDSIEQLYKQNKGLIRKIIKPYRGIEDPEDLQQEAYFGLTRAAELWKPDAGAKFSTYAAYWIRQALRRYIDDCGGVVRVPVYKRSMIAKYNRITNSYKVRFARDPSDLELRYLLEISQEQLEDIRKDIKALRTRSTSEPIGSEEADGLTLEDTLPAEGDPYEEVLDRIQQEQLRAELWGLVDTLEHRRAYLIRQRYLEGWTLKECGDALGLSTERCRQLELKALRELRNPRISARLEVYLTDGGAYKKGLAGTGYAAFRRTHTSPQEKAMIELENVMQRMVRTS